MKAIPIEKRFWDKVKIGEGCWEWQACRDDFGYGVLKKEGKPKRTQRAHIIAWTRIYKQELPKGMCVLHHCDNPGCVKEDHLYVGTRIENNFDKEIRNRGKKRENHPFSKFKWEEICMMRKIWQTGLFKISRFAKAYGINHSHMRAIVDKKIWLAKV
jgi:hypothetical protein